MSDKIQMPASTAGITRFFDEYHSKVSFKPGLIVILALLVIAVEIVLYVYGNQFFGLT